MSRVQDALDREVATVSLVNQMTIMAVLAQELPEGDTAHAALNVRMRTTQRLVERLLGREPALVDPSGREMNG